MALRLEKLRTGHHWLRKLHFATMPRVVGFPPNDVIRTLTYRPRLFGRPFSSMLHAVLRGPSFWTVAERELFASWVSSRNQCMF